MFHQHKWKKIKAVNENWFDSREPNIYFEKTNVLLQCIKCHTYKTHVLDGWWEEIINAPTNN